LAARAHAAEADRELVVVVEAAPSTAIDATALRRRIGDELRRTVVGPDDPRADTASDLLVVAVDDDGIRMSLHGGMTDVVARRVALPPDRDGRLKTAGWLAGNLARDQVSGIVAALPPEPAPEPAAATPAAPTPVVVTPAVDTMAPPPFTPAESVRARAVAPAVTEDPRSWSVTVAGGATATSDLPWIHGRHLGDDDQILHGQTYEIGIQRRASEALVWGLVLDVEPQGASSASPNYLGAAGTIGRRWQHRRWFVEATIGAGVEAAQIPVQTTTYTNTSTNGPSSSTTVAGAARPVLFARAGATFGFPVSATWDLLAGAVLHVTPNGFDADFAAATFGVRMRLP
jgi:hypothetical protein